MYYSIASMLTTLQKVLYIHHNALTHSASVVSGFNKYELYSNSGGTREEEINQLVVKVMEIPPGDTVVTSEAGSHTFCLIKLSFLPWII